jgi:hypothetical protein
MSFDLFGEEGGTEQSNVIVKDVRNGVVSEARVKQAAFFCRRSRRSLRITLCG